MVNFFSDVAQEWNTRAPPLLDGRLQSRGFFYTVNSEADAKIGWYNLRDDDVFQSRVFQRASAMADGKALKGALSELRKGLSVLEVYCVFGTFVCCVDKKKKCIFSFYLQKLILQNQPSRIVKKYKMYKSF